MSNIIEMALDLLPESQLSLKVCRMPPYHLDCSDIGWTRVYGNGWSFVVPRQISAYNFNSGILSQTRGLQAGEALTAQLLAIYGDWQPERKPTTRRALVVHLLARQMNKAA